MGTQTPKAEDTIEIKIRLTLQEREFFEAYVRGLRTTNEVMLAFAKAMVREFNV